MDTNCGTASTTAYANAGSYDHVVIPGGQCAPATGGATNLLNDKYCGTQLNCLTAVPAVTTAATAGTVCSNQRPFKISVKSDDREYHNPTALSEAGTGKNVGFSLSKYFSQLIYLVITFCLFRLLYADYLSHKTKWLTGGDLFTRFIKGKFIINIMLSIIFCNPSLPIA